MNIVASLLFFLLGAVLGTGAFWFFLRNRIAATSARLRAEIETDKHSTAARLQEALASIEELEARLRLITSEAGERERELVAECEAEGKRRQAAEEGLARIPKLEGVVAARDAMIGQLTTERDRQRQEKEELAGRLAETAARNDALQAERDALQAKIAENEASLRDGLLLVRGNHYLPASVVRTLTGKTASQSGPTDKRT